MLEDTRERNKLLEDQCDKIGRDPLTIRRSLLVFHSDMDSAYDSVDVFEDEVGRFEEASIDEFIFPFPLKEERRAVFERIANDAIPKLRR